jgi:hypothetical protein
MHNSNLGLLDIDRLPSRLVDVGEDEISSAGTIYPVNTIQKYPKLRSLKDIDVVKYITLSHRWGNKKHLTTTLSNLESHFNLIPMDHVSKNFRDAVIVTQRLGFRFLWIDSLCIVQDDPQDWFQESLKMGDIYMSAEFTLAAHATDDDGGFLEPALRLPNTRPFQYCQGGEELVVTSPNLFEQDVNGSALSKRGWVLQERLLSSRIVHFVPHCIYVESRDEDQGISQVEAEPDSYITVFHTSDFATQLYKTRTSRPVIPSKNSKKSITLDWLKVVKVYARCDLTRPSDKLIAISGLARQYHKCTGSPYYAGLWHDFFHAGLCWIVRGCQSSRRVSNAPSWSWASVNGQITYPSGCFSRKRLTSAIESFDIDALSSDTNRPSKVAWLEGQALLNLNVQMRGTFKLGTPTHGQHEHWVVNQGQRFIDGRQLEKDNFKVRRVLDYENFTVGWAVLDEDSGGDKSSSLYRCIKIADIQLGTISCHVVLFLAKASTASDLYRRIGVGQIFDEDWFENTQYFSIAVC